MFSGLEKHASSLKSWKRQEHFDSRIYIVVVMLCFKTFHCKDIEFEE